MSNMNVFDHFLTLSKTLDGTPYCLVGGVAMAFHGFPRFTEDIDLLVTPESFEELKEKLLESGYFESTKPWPFNKTKVTIHRFMCIDGSDHLVIDILVGQDPRHKEIIDQALSAEHEDLTIPLAQKADLIWLKSIRASKQDEADIERLENE